MAFTDTGLARRVLFISTLLFIGAGSVSVFHYAQTQSTTGLPGMGVFAWGMDSIGTVLALWLVTRTSWSCSGSGFLRMAIYIAAYAYGRMLCSARQDWWTTSDAVFRFPGNTLEDYARPAIDLLCLVMFAWLCIPVAIFPSRAFFANKPYWICRVHWTGRCEKKQKCDKLEADAKTCSEDCEKVRNCSDSFLSFDFDSATAGSQSNISLAA